MHREFRLLDDAREGFIEFHGEFEPGRVTHDGEFLPRVADPGDGLRRHRLEESVDGGFVGHSKLR